MEAPRLPFVALAFSGAIGIAVADFFPASLGYSLVLVFAVAAIALVWRSMLTVSLFLTAIFFTLHIVQHFESPGLRLSRALASHRQPVEAKGVVISEPAAAAEQGDAPRSQFFLQLEGFSLGDVDRFEPARVLVKWMGVAPAYGDRVTISGDARNVPPVRNPAQFDYPGYLRRIGIYSEIRVRYPSEGEILSHGHGNPAVAFALVARRWLQDRLETGIADAPDVAGLVQSMVLGLKDETEEETRELFQRTGTLHLFVVNGLHVGMLALIAWFLVKPSGLGRRRAVLVIIPLLIFYALVTGLSSGSIRATIMAAIVLSSHLAERPAATFNNLAAAAFVILLWDTDQLFRPGFQFSFGVVFTIVLLAGRIRRRLVTAGRPDPFLPRLLWRKTQRIAFGGWERFTQLLGVSFSAWLGSLPFTAQYFHLWSPSAVVANLVVVPTAFVILFQGILAMLSGAFSNAIAAIFNNANWLCAKVMFAMVHGFAAIPGGHSYLELNVFQARPAAELEIFDVNAGGAIFLRAKGADWLIDSGSEFASENIVQPYLRARGVNRLDGFVLSHGSIAHVGGAAFMARAFSPRQIVDAGLRDRASSRRDFHRWLLSRGIGKGIYGAGDVLDLGHDATLTVLYPDTAIAPTASADKSLVLRLECAGARVLFTFESGFYVERWLLEHGADLKSDLLVKGWHPQDVSATPAFLDAVAPQAIICSSAEFPASARVPDAWEDEVVRRGIALFRQNKTGAVHVAIEPDRFVIRTFLDDQLFRSRKR